MLSLASALAALAVLRRPDPLEQTVEGRRRPARDPPSQATKAAHQMGPPPPPRHGHESAEREDLGSFTALGQHGGGRA